MKSSEIGEGVATGNGTFVFPIRFELGVFMYDGEVVLELDGDMASRVVQQNWVRVQ